MAENRIYAWSVAYLGGTDKIMATFQSLFNLIQLMIMRNGPADRTANRIFVPITLVSYRLYRTNIRRICSASLSGRTFAKKALDLRIQMPSNIKSVPVAIGSKKTCHPVVRQMYAV